VGGRKVCRDYEVAVGTSQACQNNGVSGGCQAILSTIWTSDCGQSLARGWTENICKNDYDRGYSVTCSGNSITEVRNTKGERFAQCYKPNMNNGTGAQHNWAHWCCRIQ
jgi:hypothetical protein